MEEAIPFTISGLKSGFAKADGLVSLDDDILTLECVTKDKVIGAFESGVQEFRIPLSDLDSIEYIKKLFGARIRLRASKMIIFDGFPGHQRGEIELQFARREREVAKEFSKLIMHKLKSEFW
jgi:hypothetical protein